MRRRERCEALLVTRETVALRPTGIALVVASTVATDCGYPIGDLSACAVLRLIPKGGVNEE